MSTLLASLFVSLVVTEVIALNCLELAAVIPAGKCWKDFTAAERCGSLVIEGLTLTVFNGCPAKELGFDWGR